MLRPETSVVTDSRSSRLDNVTILLCSLLGTVRLDFHGGVSRPLDVIYQEQVVTLGTSPPPATPCNKQHNVKPTVSTGLFHVSQPERQRQEASQSRRVGQRRTVGITHAD